MANKKFQPCYMCDNGRINEDLNDDNDLSCISVGDMPEGMRLMVCSGDGKPLRIEFEEWNERHGWMVTGIYYPPCCPNCGRVINEYE